ncbi:MAG TPA: hypothetical protein VG410_14180 [Solirubrobacteraceae bacterium]|nr:hypothetical protein [Solirubrobacteraceae bacterium]
MSDDPNIVRAADEHAASRPLIAVLGSGNRSASKPEPSPHAYKFRAATALLAGLAIGAVAVAITLLVNGNHSGPTKPWSSWSPPDNGAQGAQEIADHLAPFYRINGTNQLAVVTVVKLGNPNSVDPTTGAPTGLQVAVKTDGSTSGLSLLNGNTIAYNLCGIGSSNCTIGIGKPSALRLLLLKREALELALYTFKYISGTTNVVAILPPGYTTQNTLTSTPHAKPVTQKSDLALLFLRDELLPFLSQPVTATLPNTYPPAVSQLSLWAQTPEAGLVEQVTARGLFSEQLVQTQAGANLIELTQQPPS